VFHPYSVTQKLNNKEKQLMLTNFIYLFEGVKILEIVGFKLKI